METTVRERLLRLESDCGLQRRYTTPAGRLEDLIVTLRRRSGRHVVLLVDEYDKPITDALDTPAVAKANRAYLRKLYSVIKEGDEHVRFSLLTGVSKFSKIILFSSLNNLTLDPRYSSIWGYADHQLDTVIAPELPGLDRDRIREWHNGYGWGGDERRYNPCDVLLHLASRDLKDYWFETGTPSSPSLKSSSSAASPPPSFDGMHATDELLSAFDVRSISIQTLLFQTDDLTIERSELRAGQRHYRLRYPNREVSTSLNRHLLAALTPPPPEDDPVATAALQDEISSPAVHIRAAEFAKMRRSLRAFFASIPHDWHRNNGLDRFEGYYASVFVALLNGCGFDARPEQASSGGQPRRGCHHSRAYRSVRVQDRQGQAGLRQGFAAAQGQRLRAQAPHLRQARPLGRRGVEHQGPQRGLRAVGDGRH